MRIIACIVFIATWACCTVLDSSGAEQTVPDSQMLRKAREILESDEILASAKLGHGRSSEAGWAFSSILGSEQAVEVFEALIEDGERLGPLYGLIGLSLVSRDRYEKYQSHFEPSATVAVRNEDLTTEMSVGAILERIENDGFANLFRLDPVPAFWETYRVTTPESPERTRRTKLSNSR